MSCAEGDAALLQDLADGTLDLVVARAVERHLALCLPCRAEQRRQRTLRTALRRPAVVYRAPAALRLRVVAAAAHAQDSRRRWQRLWPAAQQHLGRIVVAAASLLLAVARS